MDELANLFKKKYADLYYGNNLPEMVRESTGVACLDYVTGGGFVRGRIHELFGGSSCGKTTHALLTTKTYLERGMTCVYLDLERTLDNDRTHTILGVENLDNFHYVQPPCGEAAVEGILDATKLGADFIVVDSVPYLTSHQSDEAEIGHSVIGAQARFMSGIQPKLVSAISSGHTILLLINQLRTTFNFRGAKQDTSGGVALKYMCTMRIELSRWGATPEKDGETLHYSAAKNKSYNESQYAESILYYDDRSIDIYEGLRYILEKQGVIIRNGAYYKLSPEFAAKHSLPEKLSQGKAACIEKLKTDKELYTLLYNTMLDEL